MGERERPRLSREEVFTAEHVPLGLSRYTLNGSYGAHSHDFIEVALMLAGEGVHHTARGEQTVRAGDAFVLRPGSWHAYGDCRRLDVYNCCFGTELLRRELAWALEDPLVGRLFGTGPLSPGGRAFVSLRLAPDVLGVCRQHLDALLSLQHAGEPHARVERMGRLLLLLGVLARHAARDPLPESPAEPHPAVLLVARMLEADLERAWELRDLAREACLDPSYLVRLFKAVTGLPPMAYLSRERLERAAYLLLSTDRTVSAVGAAVGWADPNYFARRFRAHFGVSPSAYRSRLRVPAVETARIAPTP
jgi:AraC family L-rhamnose operon transcriptional activator RhaR